MIEVQCPSCQTRYRIDEGALPQDNPTFKCSRCGHVFSGDPRPARAAEPTRPPAPVAPAAPSPRPSLQARPAPSQPQVKPGAASTSAPENPLARTFAEDEPKPNENLSFDFSDDPADDHQLGAVEEETPTADPHDDWKVGDVEPPVADEEPPRLIVDEPAPQPPRPPRRPRAKAKPPEAEEEEYVPAHSSGFFLLVFAMIVVSFAALTLLMGLAPPTSRDLLARLPAIGPEFQTHPTIASQVMLAGVHAIYQRLDDNRTALIVSGTAHNQSDAALHAIQIGVNLVDAQQRSLVSQAVFCGDIVSPRIAGQMTAHELQFFQKLAPPRNFVLKSGDSAPFLAIFIDPPARSNGFTVSVLKAEPPVQDTANAPGV
jgi:predicted Zn finger-like uncharacterized protein